MTQFNPNDIKLPAEWPGQVQGAARTAIAWIGGYIVAKGWIPADQLGPIVAVAIPAGVWAWGAISKHLSHKALNAAIAAPAGLAK